MYQFINFKKELVLELVKGIGTGIGKTKLGDRVRVYRQHIRQPEYQKLKVEEHLRTCGKGTFKIFPLLQMRSSEIDLCRSYERNFMKKYKTKLNNL